ncbi:Uncharacterized protein dnm_090070 [Desulfonema magnum]|uniref:Uncharacterized protein n=1 Tax=Desulfonema magnum TaxID=45655 RepID=A0A975BWB0_9BACT|nr:Uncharacterized protein dnm_090070 [Desulfonema magnum]
MIHSGKPADFFGCCCPNILDVPEVLKERLFSFFADSRNRIKNGNDGGLLAAFAVKSA